MPTRRADDDFLADPLKLLAKYRELCQLLGGCVATNTPFPQEARERLANVEAELQSRLWLAGRGDGDPAASRQPSANGKRREASRAPTPEPRTQNSEPSQSSLLTLHSSVPATGTAMVYSDGSCLGNPGPGGYGTIVRVPGHSERVISGGKARTTNNEMELTGAVEGLKAAISMGAGEIAVVSDSEYMVKGMNSWMKGWLRNGWKTRTGDPVKNRELWQELHRLTQGRPVTWSWVAGHAGHVENERCNSLAIAAAQQSAGRR